MTDIVFEDPPPPRNGSARRQAMDENPGKWILWRTARRSGGSFDWLTDCGYEVTQRTQADGTVKVYARRPACPRP